MASSTWAIRCADELRAEFSRSKTPVVLAGTIDPEQQVGSVNIDYIGATEEVVANTHRERQEEYCFRISISIQSDQWTAPPEGLQERFGQCKHCI